ncbi:MAG TPA: long-chain fatty acid--CoA ligase [Bacillales bacterium]|nr:long-chain fatty acid--CoA ligase [Bacillales bacterium]
MKPKNLIEMLSNTVERYPDKSAVMWKGEESYQSLSYRNLWDQIYHTASGLARLEVKQGDKVAILSENNPMWAITDFAVGSLGAVSTPIYPTLPYDQVAYILKNADVKVAVVENEEQLQKIKDVDADVHHNIVMYPGAGFSSTEGVISFFDLEKDGVRNQLPDWEQGWRMIDRDNLATIIHTSGTTGPPKGVMLSHGNFLSNMEAVQFWVIELLPEDVSLSYLPLSHVFERMAGHFMPLSVGATIAYAESIDKIQDNVKEVRPTIMTSVPRLFEKVYAKVQEEIEGGSPVKRKIFNWAVDVGKRRYECYLNSPVNDLVLHDPIPAKLQRQWKLADRLVYQKVKKQLGGRMRGMVSGGGALNPEIARFFWALDLPILEGYGLTETSPVITTNPMVRAKAGTVGKPLPNLEIRIAEDGEVLVKGPSVMQGYYKNEEATKKDIVDGWFHTGDIGELDEEGYLKIIDRKKRLLILSTGKNVAPQPIENAINESRYVEQSAIIGDNRKYVIAFVSPDFENLLPWAEKQGIQSESKEEICRDIQVLNLLQGEVERYTKSFAGFEQPKKVIVVGEEWTVEGGELTPTLKVKMKKIHEKYSRVIEQVYAQTETAAGLESKQKESVPK